MAETINDRIEMLVNERFDGNEEKDERIAELKERIEELKAK